MSRLFWSRQEYIETLAKALKAREDFDSLEYITSGNDEYMILKDIIGHVFMFDVTGFSEAQILHTIAIVECGFKPDNLIDNRDRQMAIARLRK